MENLREGFIEQIEVVKIRFCKTFTVFVSQLSGKRFDDLQPIFGTISSAQLLLCDSAAKEPVALYESDIDRLICAVTGNFDDAAHILQDIPATLVWKHRQILIHHFVRFFVRFLRFGTRRELN